MTSNTTGAVWIKGDPLHEAIAAAVYEQCGTHPEVAVTVDDPRTIAAVAAVVARRILGTTEQADTVAAPDVDRATALTDRERQFLTFALDMAAEELSLGAGFTDEDSAALDHLRRLADAAQQPTPAVDCTERPEDAVRRFARRLFAIEQLCSGRPGYHTVTVKQVLTAMSDADDEPTPAPAEETK